MTAAIILIIAVLWLLTGAIATALIKPADAPHKALAIALGPISLLAYAAERKLERSRQ